MNFTLIQELENYTNHSNFNSLEIGIIFDIIFGVVLFLMGMFFANIVQKRNQNKAFVKTKGEIDMIIDTFIELSKKNDKDTKKLDLQIESFFLSVDHVSNYLTIETLSMIGYLRQVFFMMNKTVKGNFDTFFEDFKTLHDIAFSRITLKNKSSDFFSTALAYARYLRQEKTDKETTK